MPQCCRCNGSGRCKGCVCAKNKRLCTSCMPGRNGRCENQAAPNTLSCSPQVRLPDIQTTLPGTANDETQSYESEVIPEILNSMADGSPDDQYQALSEETVIINGLERLPPIIPMQSPVFRWKEVEGEEFVQAIESCYEEVVHWKRNLYKVPSGRAGKLFVHELTRMFQAYADASALESVALLAAMVMPALLQ